MAEYQRQVNDLDNFDDGVVTWQSGRNSKNPTHLKMVSNEEAAETFAERVAALTTLNEVGRLVTSTQSQDELFNQVADVLVNRLGFTVSIIATYSHSAGFTTRASCGCPEWRLIKVNSCLNLVDAEKIASPQSIDSLKEQMNTPEVYISWVPRRENQQSIILIVGADKGVRSYRDHEDLLITFADYVSVGIENDELYGRLCEEKRALETAKAQLSQWASTLEERVAERTLETRRRVSQLTILNTLAKAINQSLDPSQMSETVLQLVCEVFGADMGVVWIFDKDYNITLHANVGMPENWSRRKQHGFSDERFVSQLKHVHYSIITADTSLDISNEALVIKKLGMGSAAITPIKSRSELIGIMVIGAVEPSVIDQDDTTVLDVFSEQFGVGITNAQLYEEARLRAEKDQVTGLYNHRILQQRLVQAMEAVDKSRDTLAVVLMDLDNFKFFNETYGHLNGDDVLRMVARTIEQVCRPEDFAGRYGGDEFMILLPGSDHKRAAGVAQKVRRVLAQSGYRVAGQTSTVPLEMSYGIAVYPIDGLSRHELIVQADASLFRSKKGGGDVVSAQSPHVLRARSIPGYETLDSLVSTVDNKDRYTRRHSEDVAEYAYMLGKALGLSANELDTLAVAGLLHDVGKIGVPDAILRKPGKLNSDELRAIQTHPTFGALIVSAIPALITILPAVRHHHERWDGRGYPDGLAGDEIPFIARIMAVADSVSAMTTNRPYRNGMQWDDVIEAIENGLGSQFDPIIGRTFIEVMREKNYMPSTCLNDIG